MGFNGYFLQEEDTDADADPATSEGLFVYAPGSTAVAEGDLVRLTGTPAEYQGLTQLTDVRDVQVCATGALDQTSVTDVALPMGEDARESLEGMRVAVPQRLTVTERAIAKHTSNIFAKLNLPPSDDDNRRVLAVLAYLNRS